MAVRNLGVDGEFPRAALEIIGQAVPPATKDSRQRYGFRINDTMYYYYLDEDGTPYVEREGEAKSPVTIPQNVAYYIKPE